MIGRCPRRYYFDIKIILHFGLDCKRFYMYKASIFKALRCFYVIKNHLIYEVKSVSFLIVFFIHRTSVNICFGSTPFPPEKHEDWERLLLCTHTVIISLIHVTHMIYYVFTLLHFFSILFHIFVLLNFKNKINKRKKCKCVNNKKQSYMFFRVFSIEYNPVVMDIIFPTLPYVFPGQRYIIVPSQAAPFGRWSPRAPWTISVADDHQGHLKTLRARTDPDHPLTPSRGKWMPYLRYAS